MERHLRRNVDLELPRRLAELLGQLRASAGITAPAVLDVDRVRDVEAAMGTRLPDPVLALLCSGLPFLHDHLSVGLGEIPRHSVRARELHARGDLVVFGADPDKHVFHGFVIAAADDRVAVFDGGDRSLHSFSVVEWLTNQAELAQVQPSPAPPVVVSLVRAPKPEPEGRRVQHAKWGMGRLLAEQGSGPNRKIKVAFADVGVKTIVARFVEFLDPE
ncbi:DNA-dependent helicase II [Enhygromyxa salina]|uniref:DNA-dependent helicase II n=1 Tax=Enhygromyxa salina TaxID=215803 RepID=A0A2S9XCY7_9BACT|nr:hypothetical protein [Enhygromyxa salina]PRP90724.1 DNA-dependent helicase II [Enhygromyxa salina]